MVPKLSHLRVPALPVTIPTPRAVLRASPPLAALTKASLSNRHHIRVLLSLFASRNLLKSLLTFRPVNRRTLKPGVPIWKMLLQALWVAVWPGVVQGLAKLIIKDPVGGGVEVEACEERVSDVDGEVYVEMEVPAG